MRKKVVPKRRETLAEFKEKFDVKAWQKGFKLGENEFQIHFMASSDDMARHICTIIFEALEENLFLIKGGSGCFGPTAITFIGSQQMETLHGKKYKMAEDGVHFMLDDMYNCITKKKTKRNATLSS